MDSKKTYQYMTLGWVTTFLGIWELTDGISSDYEWQFEAVLNLFEACFTMGYIWKETMVSTVLKIWRFRIYLQQILGHG